MSKIDLFLFVHFFLENFSLFKLSYIPFDRASLALQNCIYDIFPGPQYVIEKSQNTFFFYQKISYFFQYFDQITRSEIDYQKIFCIIL